MGADRYWEAKDDAPRLLAEARVRIAELEKELKALQHGMKLFVVIDNERWGYSHNVVRAANEHSAAMLVSRDGNVSEVLELSEGGPEAVLWTHDESPDTGD